MEEFELLVNTKDIEIIKNIDRYIEKFLEKVEVINFIKGDFISYSFKGMEIDDFLLNLYEIIYLSIKFTFLYEEIKCLKKESKFFYAILGFLCSSNQRKEFIDNVLPSLFNVKKLNVDGLNNFIMSGLKKEWARYGNFFSVAYRLNYLNDNEKEIKILKNTYRPSDVTFEVNLKNAIFGKIIVDSTEELLYTFSKSFANDLAFNLFLQAPKKVVFCNNIPKEVVGFIDEIFGN